MEIKVILTLKEFLEMADIADNVLATLAAVNELAATVNTLAATVAALAAPTVDLTPVLTAITALGAQLQPTPVATPEPAPAPAAETSSAGGSSVTA